MRYHVFGHSEKYPIALLVKSTAFNITEITEHYIKPLESMGLSRDDMIIIAAPYNEKGKAPVTFIKEQLDTILSGLRSIGTETIYCADAPYFKVLTKKRRPTDHLGYVVPCTVKDFEMFSILLGINQKTSIFDPKNQTKLDNTLQALANHEQGHYLDPGRGVAAKGKYLLTAPEIKAALDELHQHPILVLDIEAGSLRFERAGVGTVTFCWSETEGIAFPVDYRPLTAAERDPESNKEGILEPNQEVRALLRDFLAAYRGRLVAHNASYDLKVLIYNLWMKDGLDVAGMMEGLRIMTRDLDDTKIIAYLATNSATGNELKLKTLAQPFAGNWAEDVRDITLIPQKRLLEYNLIDGLSTWYVRNTFRPRMIQDQQGDLYRDLMMPSLRTIIQTELVGMPLNPTRVQEVKAELIKDRSQHIKVLRDSPLVVKLNELLQREAMEAANAKLKIKQHPLSKFADVEYNPNSPNQTGKLLYEIIGLPVIDLTKTKLPATGMKTLKKLVNHTKDPEAAKLLDALVHYSEIDKILTSFIPAFEQAVDKGQLNTYWLHGSFNLGGTVSGRLSSSDPNLQNLPSNSTYGKLIKSCFQAPKGWLFCGADFNSLEDYVSALQTKDPNKLKVYKEGYDGHCLRAFYYFKDQMPDIVETPSSINSIKKKYPELRQTSKNPTFLLTYGGTFHGMVNNLGWERDKAKKIEASYHELYKVSDEWVQARLDQASIDGYVTCAFGLRVRTPLLKKTLRRGSQVPYEAKSEARTAGNALGQSYGLLTNRALNEFMEKVWNSPYWDRILPIGLIHDALYFVVEDSGRVVKFVNDNLIKAMQWQELPDIKHDTVKLGAELSIFWPSWAKELSLPNNIHEIEIRRLCNEFKEAS